MQAGDKVKVRYGYGSDKFYTGTVLWTSDGFGDLKWATVRPDDEKMIYTFGSSRDMSNGYKSYIYGHPVLGVVFTI